MGKARSVNPKLSQSSTTPSAGPSTGRAKRANGTSSSGFSHKSSGAVGEKPAQAMPEASALRVELAAIGYALHVLGMRAEVLSAKLANRKLAQLSRVLSALETALTQDREPRALNDPDGWALKYLDGKAATRGAFEARPRPATLQEAARAMAVRLGAMKGKSTRSDVAARLAVDVDQALYFSATAVTEAQRQRQRRDLTLKIRKTMRHKVQSDGDLFAEDAELTVVAAFKEGGLKREVADQLFKTRR